MPTIKLTERELSDLLALAQEGAARYAARTGDLSVALDAAGRGSSAAQARNARALQATLAARYARGDRYDALVERLLATWSCPVCGSGANRSGPDGTIVYHDNHRTN